MQRFRSSPSAAALTAVAGLVLGAFVGAAAAPARAQVLDQVPADAMVVVKVNNPKGVSQKIARFAEAVALAEIQPASADLLGMIQEETGMKEGVDTAGELAFVVTSPPGGDFENSVLLLLPVTDFKAFLGNFPPGQAENGVTQVRPPDGEMDLYVAEWGKYAAVSPNKGLVVTKPTKALKLTGLTAEQAKSQDVILYANMPVIREIAIPALKQSREQMLTEFERGFDRGVEAGDADAPGAAAGARGPTEEQLKQLEKYRAVFRALGEQWFNGIEQFLNDAEAATIGFRMSDDGIHTTVAAQFTPESYLGKLAVRTENTEADLMAGLPDRKYFAFGGAAIDPDALGQLVTDLVDPVRKELDKTDADGAKQFADALGAAEKAAKATRRVAFGYTVPTGALGTDSILQAVSVMEGDAAAIHDAQTKILRAYASMMQSVPQGGGEGQPQVSFDLKTSAKTVGGVKLDQYKINFELDENDPAAAQAAYVYGFMFGPNGMGGTMGPVDADTYLSVQGGTDKLLEAAVAAAKQTKPVDLLSQSPAVKSVAAQLPKQRVLVEYVAVDQIIKAGVKYAQGFGMPVQLRLPANLPPIGMSLATDGAAVRFDSFVPTQLVQSVVAAGIQSYMQMQGGDEGGPDGL